MQLEGDDRELGEMEGGRGLKKVGKVQLGGSGHRRGIQEEATGQARKGVAG